MSTLVDKIVLAMREDIYKGELEAGRPLKQVELAHRYGVSPIPLREAMQRLQMEGLIEHFAYRGAIVARTRKAEAADVADIRNALESLAFRIAMPTLDDEQLDQLEGITVRIESPRVQADGGLWLECVLEYFEVLLSKCNRPLLLDMIQANLKRAARYYAEGLRASNGQLPPTPSRQAYLQAIRERDCEQVVALMEQRHAAFVEFFHRVLPE